MKAINKSWISGNPGVSDFDTNGEDEVGPSERMLWRFKIEEQRTIHQGRDWGPGST